MAKTRRKSTRKRMHSVKSRKPTPYPNVVASTSYMNVSQTWKNGHGRRNTVVIANGKGEKRVELLGASGEVVKRQTRKLTDAERAEILAGRFIPGLWRNCRLTGTC